MTEYGWITAREIAEKVFALRTAEEWDAEPGTVDGEVSAQLMGTARGVLEKWADVGVVERHPTEPDTYRATDTQTIPSDDPLIALLGDRRERAAKPQ